ncbi:MAG TPA: methyltransferase domain-containing protein [Usitatibacter sp.]|nr:methyltransferase domain-containing protein [Usitatibacter sp.]
MDIGAYHVLELQIAADPVDSRRVMPAIRPEHRRIIDVGCGAGQTLIASRLGADVTAVGIDSDPGALSLGRILHPRLQLIRARGESLPLPSQWFDLAISRVALPYMRTSAALAEMARVLRPGGDLWIVLHPASLVWGELKTSLKRGRWGAALQRAYALANGALLHLTGRELPAPYRGKHHSFQTEARIVSTLASLGFENIRVDKRRFFVVTATKRKTQS